MHYPEKDIDNLINRIVHNDYTEEEYQKFSNLFLNEKALNLVKETIRKEWHKESKEEFGKEELNHILENIIAKAEIRKTSLNRKYKFYSVITRVAAFLFIPVLAAAIYLYIDRNNKSNNNEQSTWAEIQSPLGARTAFELPDGTTGYLNSNSKIKYTIPFESNRKIEITGEAYFNVKHIINSSFIVATPFFDVQVKGTKFDVISYPHEKFIDVILEQGKVDIIDRKRQTSSSLVPNQKLSYSKDKKLYTISDVDAELHVSWTTGKLKFRNELLPEVLRRLSRRYYVEFKLVDEHLENYRYRATFEHESLDEILKLLTLTAPIKYKITEPELKEYTKNDKKQISLMLKN